MTSKNWVYMTYRLILRWNLVFLFSLSSFTSFAKSTNENKMIEKKAHALFKKNKCSQVVKILLPINHNISKSSKLLLSECLHKQKNYQEEIKLLERIIEEDEKDYLTFKKLADAYLELKNESKAIENYRKSIKLNSKYFPAYENLLFLYEIKDNFYESRIILKDMIEIFGDRPEFYHKLCRVDSLEGYLDSSIKYCIEAIHLDPEFAESYVYLANNYKDIGDQVKAEKAYTSSAKKFLNSEFVQSAAGKYFFENKNFHAAFKNYQQAATADPKSSRALIGLALSAIEIEKYELSLESFLKACKIDKTTQFEFRKAATKLRVKQVYKWSRDFEAKSHLCKLNN